VRRLEQELGFIDQVCKEHLSLVKTYLLQSISSYFILCFFNISKTHYKARACFIAIVITCCFESDLFTLLNIIGLNIRSPFQLNTNSNKEIFQISLFDFKLRIFHINYVRALNYFKQELSFIPCIYMCARARAYFK
jgi:hypothetical protein